MLSYVMLCCVNYINYLNKEYNKFTINIRIFFMLLSNLDLIKGKWENRMLI